MAEYLTWTLDISFLALDPSALTPMNPCFFTPVPLQYMGEMVILMGVDENSLATDARL